jgi:hypothetical protein
MDREEYMELKDYFENAKGLGVLATSDADGKVDVAVYSRPHVMAEDTVAFIMHDRLTHHNLGSNPHAAYLFVEEGTKSKGKRLFLTKTKEEKDTELIQSLRRKDYGEKKGLYLVYFNVDKILPILGSQENKGNS